MQKTRAPALLITWMISFLVVRDSFLRSSVLLLGAAVSVGCRSSTTRASVVMMVMVAAVMMMSAASTTRLIDVVSLITATRAWRRRGLSVLGTRTTTITVSQACDAVYITMTIRGFWFCTILCAFCFVLVSRFNVIKLSKEEEKERNG